MERDRLVHEFHIQESLGKWFRAMVLAEELAKTAPTLEERQQWDATADHMEEMLPRP